MKHRSKKRYLFDFDAFLRAIILLGFVVLLMWLVRTQQLTLYINPKFTGLVEIASYLLLPMFLTQALTVFRPANAFHNHHHSHLGRLMYIPFMLVLGLAFALPNNTLNASFVNAKGFNSQLSAPVSTYEMSRPLAPQLRQLSSIEVIDRDYTEIMSEIQFFPQDYIGKEIVMTGFVFRPPGSADNQFSLVRYVVMCCTADALPYGVLCELPDADKYEEGTWLSIKGFLQRTTYEDKTVPAIKITSLKQVPEPKNPYVFPPSQ